MQSNAECLRFIVRVLGTNSHHKAQMWVLEPPIKTATFAYGSARKMFPISPKQEVPIV